MKLKRYPTRLAVPRQRQKPRRILSPRPGASSVVAVSPPFRDSCRWRRTRHRPCPGMMRRARPRVRRPVPPKRYGRSVPHCSVGCGIIAEVRTASGPARNRPSTIRSILGRIAPRGAAVREHGHGERRPQVSDQAGQRQMAEGLVGQAIERHQWPVDQDPRGPVPIRSTGSARPSSTTSRPICTASSPRCGAPTTSTTRRASVIRPRSRVLPTPGATVR